MTLYTQAQGYLAAGLSVLPCDRRLKRPAFQLLPRDTAGKPTWIPFRQQLPTPDVVQSWFEGRRAADAVAIITGPVSGELEVLDFDAPQLMRPWAITVQTFAPGLLRRLPIVQTQSGGWHVYFRSAAAAGNQKLAVAPEGDKYTLIETRGAGGYVLAPPSAGYTLKYGSWDAIPTLDALERGTLLAAARAFSQAAPTPPTPQRPQRSRSTDKRLPGNDYNQRGDFNALLTAHGWTFVRQCGATQYWRRPGKRRGISATYNHGGHGYFYVFSTNAPPFEPERGYTPFAAYALLTCHADFSAAARELRQQGFGAQHT
ncbi:MAG: bifunctional DNA primase/polymerase [Chloroflexota bacterium]|nr:bifunctional DNA primase/polymerase [Chloroflexota bacterium]